MWKTAEGSTGRLLQLCFGYFFTYTLYLVAVKWFLAKPYPALEGMTYLVYSTSGGMAMCMTVVLSLGWYKLQSNGTTKWGPFTVPREYAYIIPSGICTAVVIPTTTLMYSLPISVMVAMVMMRASVIVISRAVDAIQIRQGLLKKKVYLVEDMAVAFALLALTVEPFMGITSGKKGEFAFLSNVPAMVILSSYLVAYAIRIYIMNYYKNTRGKGVPFDSKGFMGVEQIAATLMTACVATVAFSWNRLSGGDHPQLVLFRDAIAAPVPLAGWAIASGGIFGVVAFFSVFLFMFKGRTATFAGLVNRVTSLIAGTAATLAWAIFFDSNKWPKVHDWISLGFILVAVGFLTSAEMRRAAENAAASKQQVPAPEPTPAPQVQVTEEKRETAEG